jgi:hypothetical protein
MVYDETGGAGGGLKTPVPFKVVQVPVDAEPPIDPFKLIKPALAQTVKSAGAIAKGFG